jgi:hypothetical protein
VGCIPLKTRRRKSPKAPFQKVWVVKQIRSYATVGRTSFRSSDLGAHRVSIKCIACSRQLRVDEPVSCGRPALAAGHTWLSRIRRSMPRSDSSVVVRGLKRATSAVRSRLWPPSLPPPRLHAALFRGPTREEPGDKAGGTSPPTSASYCDANLANAVCSF